ncbi:FG-GAP-like repeat-containing protein [Lysobacter sp. Root604]|uniref:FG-GAP-like repeat-containing protein n=1 Tax=Lysobacter sp. Root604 TaxID=1736568 RepID=UPI0006FA9EE3|nr:FG-GAP-like repeat-containing protein [Lysobacter sp. Root604]KRA17185.1 hypothetical protein ASD69_10730 [Lysobacter sp. Root604]
MHLSNHDARLARASLARTALQLSFAIVGATILSNTQAATRDGFIAEYPTTQLGLSLPQVIGDNLPIGYVVLTYDDGLDEHSVEMARYLQTRNIRATFFVNGCRFTGRGAGAPCSQLKQYPTSTLEELVAADQQVGNHTELHYALNRDLATAGPTKIKQDVLLTQSLVAPYQRDGYSFFRAPSNNWGQAPYDLLHGEPALQHVAGPILYDYLGADWSCMDSSISNPTLSPEACAERIYGTNPADLSGYSRSIRGGVAKSGIIQMHDRMPNAVGSDYSFRLTKRLIELLRSDPDTKYVFTSLDAIPGMTGLNNRLNIETFSDGFSDASGTAQVAGHYRSIRMGDVTGDGVPDICGKRVDGIHCINGQTRVSTKWRDLPDSQGWSHAKYSSTAQMVDMDNDGRMDMCVRGGDGLYCFRSLGSSFATPSTWFTGSVFSDAGGWGADESMYASIQMGDIDGDSRPDVCGRDAAGIICQRFNGTSFSAGERWLTGSFDNANAWNHREYAATLRLGDINGDGRADLCGRASYGIICSLSSGTGFLPPTWWSSAFADQERWNIPAVSGDERVYFHTLSLADMNQDGKADICGQYTTGVACAFSDGTRFSAYHHVDNRLMTGANGYGRPAYALPLMIGDLDGDQRKEICTRGIEGIRCLR